MKECKNRHYDKMSCPPCVNPKWETVNIPWGAVMERCAECGFTTDERTFCAKCSVCKEKIKLNKKNMPRKKGSKNKPKVEKVTKVSKAPKNPAEAKLEPVAAPVEVQKPLPVIDGYQVTRVFGIDHDGHTATHLLCEAQNAAGDRVRLHVDKKYF